jgi:hypothetical protein
MRFHLPFDEVQLYAAAKTHRQMRHTCANYEVSILRGTAKNQIFFGGIVT